MSKEVNRFEFDTLKEGELWFWVAYRNGEVYKKSEPYGSEEEAGKGLSVVQRGFLLSGKLNF